jgi:hypothetical protein
MCCPLACRGRDPHLHRLHPGSDRIRIPVDVTAETLYEAAILGMNALTVPRWRDNPNLKIQVRVRQPEPVHDVGDSCLSAWLARAAKSSKEQALKARLRALVRG